MKHENELIEVDTLHRLIKENTVTVLFTSMDNPVNSVTTKKDPIFIPGAMFFDFENVFVNKQHTCSNMLPSIQEFASKLSNMGISNDSKIVVYDNQGLFSSPRGWWMLKAVGHQHVSVLNGGLRAWINANLPTVNTLCSLAPANVNYIARSTYMNVVSKSELQKQFSESNVKVMDARGKKRFEGTEPDPRAGVRAGHILHSFNLHYNKLINHGKLLSDKQLQLVFESVCPDYSNHKLIFSCGSGVTACILALAATQLGHQNWLVYDGSWNEWGADNQCPVEISNG